MKHINDRHPNFYDNEEFFLVKCFNCGLENYAPNIASGTCSFCGWSEKDQQKNITK